MTGRINAYLVCGGKYHDFDFARLQLLTLFAEDEAIRAKVAMDYTDTEAIEASDFLVTYTCDVRPTEDQQKALRRFVEGGGRWFALHATNCALDPPGADGRTLFEAPRVFPLHVDTLGSQFLSHPAIEPYPVTVSPGAESDPMVQGIEPFHANDELYLSEYHGEVVPLLETHWTGTTHGFADAEWPDDDARLVLYRRPLGAGEVLYFTLGHCRSTWDMVDPPFDASAWPRLERGSWELREYHELLRRGLAWAKGNV